MGNAGSTSEQAKNSADGGSAADAEARRGPPSTVRFFPDAERQKARQPLPIKLEEEEGAPPPSVTDEEMAPRNLWQIEITGLSFVSGYLLQMLSNTPQDVYALGAFIVLRWAWAKWKENQDRKDSPDGDGDAPSGST
nr:unnamed protein product [Digitaria exilis]